MMIHVVQDLATSVNNLMPWHDWLHHGLAWYVPHDGTVLAQQFNQDVVADMQKGFNHFVKSGQIWALFIGVFFGYLIRSLTAY